jgi:hypothetical protein
MAPIPNPEDMPAAERHRIYGDAYDYLDHAGAAAEREARHHHHHHWRHHARRHHHELRHHHALEAHRVHARFGEGFKPEAQAASAGRREHAATPKPVAVAKPAKAAHAKAAPAPSHVTQSSVRAMSSAPAVSSAPASAPAATTPATGQNGGRILAAIIALLLGAFVIAMALRQTMSGARQRKPVRNYQAPPVDTGTDDKKAS